MRRLRLIKWSIPSLLALNSATLGSPEHLYVHRNITGSRKLNFIDIAPLTAEILQATRQSAMICAHLQPWPWGNEASNAWTSS